MASLKLETPTNMMTLIHQAMMNSTAFLAVPRKTSLQTMIHSIAFSAVLWNTYLVMIPSHLHCARLVMQKPTLNLNKKTATRSTLSVLALAPQSETRNTSPAPLAHFSSKEQARCVNGPKATHGLTA